MWTFKCIKCGKSKTVKRPKQRDVATTCPCQRKTKPPKITKQKIHKSKKTTPKYKHHHKTELRTFSEYIGKKNNYLTVKSVERIHGVAYFNCICDCGNAHRLQAYAWINETIKSCGCKHNELLSTHGLSKTRLYHIWQGMKRRCLNPNCENYTDYGGRGITICKEWLGDFTSFFSWAVSNNYSDELSIDRINVNDNYEPNNCRWADNFVQANNKRPSNEWKRRKPKYQLNGVPMRLNEICRIKETSEPMIRYRMNVMGMTFEQAIETPKVTQGRPRKVVNQ